MNNETVCIANQVIGYDELINAEIASKIIGLSPRTIKDWGVAGKLPTYRIGRRANRFLVRDLVEWCEERKID